MTTLSIVRVFDERDNTVKFLTDVKKDNETSPKSSLSEVQPIINDNSDDIEITITKADDPIIPRINAKGNIILELTKEQFFDIRNRLQY